MTATTSGSGMKEFELGPEFGELEEFKEITKIYTIGKTLVLEYHTGEIVQSSYFNDDSMKTGKALRNALVANTVVPISFDIDKFIHLFSKLLVRRILSEAKERDSRIKEEQCQKNSIEEEIEELRKQHAHFFI